MPEIKAVKVIKRCELIHFILISSVRKKMIFIAKHLLVVKNMSELTRQKRIELYIYYTGSVRVTPSLKITPYHHF